MNKKKLTDLLERISSYEYKGKDIEVTGITDDSRKVKKGNVFVAIKGINNDGHSYVEQALENGAIAVVGEFELDDDWPGDTVYIKVSDTREALGLMASEWFGNPSKKMKVIGITGTDGKTTTAHILYHILKTAGNEVGIVSTISAKIGSKEIDTGFHVTNPDSVSLQGILAEMVDAGCEYAVLEVTSHGLDQGRVVGVDFDVAVLTNITHEHLDYHGSLEEYRDTKAKLFQMAMKALVLNCDDDSFTFFSQIAEKNVNIISYGIEVDSAGIIAEKIVNSVNGSSFEVISGENIFEVSTLLSGNYNVSNILAAIGTAEYYGVSSKTIQRALSSFRIIEGRMEEIKNDKGFRIYIDFAHTPNSLEKVLSCIKSQTKGKLISIISCTGERDQKKRPKMASIATKLSDYCIFTSDDPRFEKINDIFDQMAKGVSLEKAVEMKPSDINNEKGIDKHVYFRIEDRGEAISFALQELAEKGDVVIICGKGHEKAMAIGSEEYPWSEHEAVEIALRGGTMRIIN